MTAARCTALPDCWCKGRRYTCCQCKRFVPFCFGGAPEPECDDCWVENYRWLLGEAA